MDDETRPLDGAPDDSGVETPTDQDTRPGTPGGVGRRREEESLVGRRLGRLFVMGTLGSGGMGTVYEAYDRTLDRRVAVKVLHRDVDPHFQQQLVHEAQALAKLSHPNVVQVYEVGQIDAQSFVAMELIEGRTLRRWLTQDPRPGWRECLELFLLAGEGLAAAHDKGIVHCDFKPGNAVVDDEGRVRVVDFGLARAVRGTSLSDRRSSVEVPVALPQSSSTTADTVVGTPAYMPLEQMEGKPVDARGDQFSFCVSLFEAVYGERPFSGRSIEAHKEARRAEVLTPVQRNEAPAALHEILRRGLAADPERRWPSMHALLERLRPLVAPRKRKTMLALGGAIALGGALAGAGLAYQAEMGKRCSGAREKLAGIWDDERRQGLEAAIRGTELSYADDTWERVGAALDAYADGWVEQHTEVCEATSVRHEQSEAVMDLRMACLQQRRVALRETVDVLAEHASSRVAQAVTLVGSLPALSRCDDVETLRAEPFLPEDAGLAEQVEVLRERLTEARALRTAGDFEEALALAEESVEWAEVLGYQPALAEALYERGATRRQKAEYAGAEEDLERSYQLAATLQHSETEAEAVRELVVVVGHSQARHDAGLQWGKTAVALGRRAGADVREEATALGSIGVILLEKGELSEALSHQRMALSLLEDALGPEDSGIADLLQNMGEVLRKQGELDEALSHFRRALAIYRAFLGPRHPDVAKPLTSIGAVLEEQGRRPEAIEHLQQALAIREGALGPEHPDLATSLNNIGIMYKTEGDLDQALAHFQRALTILEGSLGPEHPRLAYPLNNIGEVLRARGEAEGALEHYQRALAVMEGSLGAEHPTVASALINLGNLLYQEGRYDDAEASYQRALEIQGRALPEDHPLQAWPRLGLAKIALRRDEPQRAREHAEVAVSLREQGQAPAVLLAEARFVLARALWGVVEERPRARELAEQAQVAWTEAGADDSQTQEYLADVTTWLAEHPLR